MTKLEVKAINKLIKKLVKRLGYVEVEAVLESLDEYTNGLNPQRLAKKLHGLTICDETEIDGG